MGRTHQLASQDELGSVPGIARRTITAILLWTVGAVMVAAIVALLVVPRIAGGTTLSVLSGSMSPEINAGDVIAVRGIDVDEVCRNIDTGDIVTFMPHADDLTLVTHRVTSKQFGSFEDGTTCRLITQGDANSAVDAPVSPVQVRAAHMYTVPKIGWVKQWLGNHALEAGYAAAGATVLYGIWVLIAPRKRTGSGSHA